MEKLENEQLIQAKIIMLALDQNNREIPMEVNYTIIRAAVGNIINTFANMNASSFHPFVVLLHLHVWMMRSAVSRLYRNRRSETAADFTFSLL